MMEYYENDGNIEPVYVLFSSRFVRILKKCDDDLEAPGQKSGNNYIIKVDFSMLFGITLWLFGFGLIFIMSLFVYFLRDDNGEIGRIMPLLSAFALFGLAFILSGTLTVLYSIIVHPDTLFTVDETLRLSLGNAVVDQLWVDMEETLRFLSNVTIPIITPILVFFMAVGMWPEPNMELLRNDPIYVDLRDRRAYRNMRGFRGADYSNQDDSIEVGREISERTPEDSNNNVRDARATVSNINDLIVTDVWDENDDSYDDDIDDGLNLGHQPLSNVNYINTMETLRRYNEIRNVVNDNGAGPSTAPDN